MSRSEKLAATAAMMVVLRVKDTTPRLKKRAGDSLV